MSRGDSETSRLRENVSTMCGPQYLILIIIQIEDQLKRLLTQLQDIEEMKEELDEEEYNNSRQVSKTNCIASFAEFLLRRKPLTN